MDTMGNVLSEKKHGKIGRSQLVNDLIATHDGGYYTAGVSYWGNFHSFGFKFNKNNDSLWFKRYWHQDFEDQDWVENFAQKLDSNFIHNGYHQNFKSSPIDNRVYCWLLETDKYGCDTVDCSLGDFEKTSVEQQIALFPNPNHGSFNISGLEPGPTNEWEVNIYNFRGQKLCSKTIYSDTGSIEVVKQGLARGLYLCAFTINGLKFGSQIFRIN